MVPKGGIFLSLRRWGDEGLLEAYDPTLHFGDLPWPFPEEQEGAAGMVERFFLFFWGGWVGWNQHWGNALGGLGPFWFHTPSQKTSFQPQVILALWRWGSPPPLGSAWNLCDAVPHPWWNNPLYCVGLWLVQDQSQVGHMYERSLMSEALGDAAGVSYLIVVKIAIDSIDTLELQQAWPASRRDFPLHLRRVWSHDRYASFAAISGI